MKVKWILLFLYFFIWQSGMGDDGYSLWLKYRLVSHPARRKEYQRAICSISVKGQGFTFEIIRNELETGLSGLLGKKIGISDKEILSNTVLVTLPNQFPPIQMFSWSSALDTLGEEGFLIFPFYFQKKKLIVITANTEKALLYGTFHFLRLLQTETSLYSSLPVISRPKIQYRMLNHWDNVDGSVERGYAGRSLWEWDKLPILVNLRYFDYARANASIGVNAVVLNNVNANPIFLTNDYLIKVSKLADIFRPYGIRIFLSVNFASPLASQFSLFSRRGGIGPLSTADPLDSEVRKWWKSKVDSIYQLIPDFGGFLVKANSEGMPGPLDYGRTHADGANMLAEALASYGGIVIWRAFVYNPEVDPDRAKRAYKEFVPLDGAFLPNVCIQAKNGPIDFQPREPVQPLFGAMPKTPLFLELQITQEYLGHSVHWVYLGPMWKEYLAFDLYAKGKGSTLAKIIDGSLFGYSQTGIAGVANIGSDRNWCGHLGAQANWYAFGRLAWDPTLSADTIAEEWIRMTLGNDSVVIDTVQKIMLASWENCVNYMTPLGLHHIMKPDFHYGPAPEFSNAPREDWSSVYYHRADTIGIGFNRSSTGTGATLQYYPPLRDSLDQISTCPEKYLLWFYHVPWDYRMKSGRTLWEELCFKYNEGVKGVEKMLLQWESVKSRIDPEIYYHIYSKLLGQKENANVWRDTCLRYFQKFSQKEIN